MKESRIPRDPAQRVSFGTSGHRGTPAAGSFTELHILAITQAICDYRHSKGYDGPLFMGKDTHALSDAAQRTALEVLAANGVSVVIQSGDGVTPTPVIVSPRGFAQFDTRMDQVDQRDKDNGQPSYERDTRFLTSAIEAGMAEVQLAQLALTKSSSTQIKGFAQMEIDDWATINGSLKPYAKQIGVPIATKISKKDKKVQDSLSGLSGNEFDLAYAKAMVKLHKDDMFAYYDELSERQNHDVAGEPAPRASAAHFTLQDAAQQQVRILEVLLNTAQQIADNKNVNTAAIEQAQANNPANKGQKLWTVPEMNARLKEARDDNAQKKYEEAQTVMSQAVQIDPDAGALWLELGLALVGQKKYEEAIPDFNKAIELNAALKKPKPDVAGAALNELGEAYLQANKVAEACSEFEAAAKANPEKQLFIIRTRQSHSAELARPRRLWPQPIKPSRRIRRNRSPTI